MQTTTNLGLRKPGSTDPANISDLNYNSDLIDSGLGTSVLPLINQWNEQYTENYAYGYDPGQGIVKYWYSGARASSAIKVVPGKTYYITRPCTVFGANSATIPTSFPIPVGTGYYIAAISGSSGGAITVDSSTKWIFLSYSSSYTDMSVNYPSNFTGYYPSALPKAEAHACALSNIVARRSWNQLSNNNRYKSGSQNGITFTPNASTGTITLSGTCSDTIVWYTSLDSADILVKIGHKYLILGCPSGGSGSTFSGRFYYEESTRFVDDDGSGAIFTAEGNGGYGYYSIIVRSGYVANNLTFIPLVIDLTALFGSGSEPLTVADFHSMFTSLFYPYCNGDFGDLLWRNYSHTSAFSAQTISLDLSKYRCILIKYKHHTSNSEYLSTICWVDNAALLNSIFGSSGYYGNVQNGVRKMIISSSSILFYAGYRSENGSSLSSDNGFCVPVEIHGIR